MKFIIIGIIIIVGIIIYFKTKKKKVKVVYHNIENDHKRKEALMELENIRTVAKGVSSLKDWNTYLNLNVMIDKYNMYGEFVQELELIKKEVKARLS